MKRTTLLLLFLASAVLVALPACGRREVTRETTVIKEPQPSTPDAQVIVQQPPPAPREEVRGVAPTQGYVWVPGYWTWSNGWVWNPGRWELPPQRTTTWVPGQWVQTASGWVWRPGRWQ